MTSSTKPLTVPADRADDVVLPVDDLAPEINHVAAIKINVINVASRRSL